MFILSVAVNDLNYIVSAPKGYDAFFISDNFWNVSVKR